MSSGLTQSGPSNLAIAQDRRLPVEVRVDSVRKLLVANAAKLTAGMGGLLSASRVVQVACNSIRKNPDLLDCTPASLFGAISEAATYGWVCDGLMGHAYLVPFANSAKGCKEVVLIPGYKGLRDLVRRSGQCDTLMAAVHDGDAFQYQGPLMPPIHKPGDDPERRFRRPVVGAYVLAQFKSGTVKCFYWTAAECIAHRDRYCQSWKRIANRPEKRKDSPWNPENIHEFSVMCCKTVLLDAIHRGEFPLSLEEQQMARREDSIAEVESSTISGISTEQETSGLLESPQTEETNKGDGERLERLQDALAACESILQCQDAVKAAMDGATPQEQTAMLDLGVARENEIRQARGAKTNKLASTEDREAGGQG